MAVSEIGQNYAAALLDSLTSPEDVTAVGRDLATFARLMREIPGLGRVLAYPGFSFEKRRGILDEVLGPLAPHAATRRFLRIVLDKERIGSIPEMVSAFEQMSDSRSNVTRAEVVTAVPLDGETQSRWRKVLSRMTGKQVEVTYRTDGALLGGATTRIGSKVYDGSVRKQLERVRKILLAESRESHA